MLVPLGYADGIPRDATNVGPVLAAGARRTVAGTVCMDQFVLDVGDDPVAEGDEVVLFGPGDARRADGAGLGAAPRHDLLRDRHPDRAAGAAACVVGGVSELPRAGPVGVGLGVLAAGAAAGSVLGSALERRLVRRPLADAAGARTRLRRRCTRRLSSSRPTTASQLYVEIDEAPADATYGR